jgi:hypothetical protein
MERGEVGALYKCEYLVNALDFVDHRAKEPCRVIVGSDGMYWVAATTDADILVVQGCSEVAPGELELGRSRCSWR